MKSFATPTKLQIDAAEVLLSAAPQARYFFERLENPHWIEPLAERGFFSEPPSTVSVEGGGIRHPPWGESKYLARMAKAAPNAVADLFLQINTDNASVISDMLAAAADMPARVCAKLVPKICAANQSDALWVGFEHAAEQCARLAREDEANAALKLAKCLFAINDARDLERPNRRDVHWYVEGLQKVIPDLVGACTREFLELLLNSLRVIAESKSDGVTDPEYDTSLWWRPAIEEHEQNPDYDLASRFVGCVREALEITVRGTHLGLAEAIHLLDSYDWLIFKRLRIHLINECADQDQCLARQVLMSRALFDNHRYKHEYAMLCGQRLTLLTKTEKTKWFGWIDAGPDMSDFVESVKQNLGREPTEEDRRGRIEYWKFEKLHWIHDHLEGSRLDFYNRMRAEHGVPKLADLNVRTDAERSGSASPFTVDELDKKRFEDVVETISTWRPDKRTTIGPSTQGVAATFKAYLAKAAGEYVEHAAAMRHRPAMYVRAYIEAMTDAFLEVKAMDLSPLFDLCKWVIERPQAEDTAISADPDSYEDKDWRSTRASISDLVGTACQQGCLPDYRRDLWELVVPLTNDSGKSYIVGASPNDPRVKNYVTLSLNSPCGKAMHAVFAYTRWIADAVAKEVNGKQIVDGGFDKMPEVRELLERKLDADDPGGFSLRATYGWFWSLLNWIDRDWVTKNANRICDLRTIETAPEKAYGWAAWNTFLANTHPHIEHYRLLRDQFSYAVDQASTISAEDKIYDPPFQNLGEHLVILYGRGQLTLHDDNSIVQRLLTTTAPVVRTHAIRFVGESLSRSHEKDLPAAIRDRFTQLWDWYWRRIGESDARASLTNDTFGYWFVSDVFDAEWALARLEEFVRVVPKPEPHSDIVKKLAEISHVNIRRAVRILELLVDGDEENWRIYTWRRDAETILRVAMSAGEAARNDAMGVIDKLGRRGFLEFGNLLGK